MNNTVIAIDPSINFTGYAIFERDSLVQYGIIRSGTLCGDRERLKNLFDKMLEMCVEFCPDVVVVEDYQFRDSDIQGRNKDGLKKMIWSIGVIITSIPTDIDVVTYKPLEWKGKKDKKTTIFEAKAVYKLRGALDNNAADAIMLGHHYIKSRKLEGLKK